MLVAIDGPAGSGKSTVAKEVARRLGLPDINTGLAYRATALAVLKSGIDPEDEEAVAHAARGVGLTSAGATISGEPVEEGELRTPEVSAMSSAISANALLRRVLVDVQRKAAYAQKSGAVVEGRDIGTVILPEARVKVFLEASPQERARRRAHQSRREGEVERIRKAIEARDRQDRERTISPLKPAGDAVVIDTTGMSLEEVVERVLKLVEAAK